MRTVVVYQKIRYESAVGDEPESCNGCDMFKPDEEQPYPHGDFCGNYCLHEEDRDNLVWKKAI